MKHYRRIVIFFCLSIVLLLPVRAAAQPDYVRLHIIAASDSLTDQSIKLGVRDAIREYTAALLAGCSSTDEAWQTLEAHKDDLLCTAQKCASLYGHEGSVSLEMGVFPFPDRTYAGELVPAGEYRAVRIVLGEGSGRNWWCVVYPSLCLPEEADADKPLEFYSSIWRWALRLWEVIRK